MVNTIMFNVLTDAIGKEFSGIYLEKSYPHQEVTSAYGVGATYTYMTKDLLIES